MMISRAFSIFLRLGEFVSAAIVLGIMAYFIESRRRWGGPLAREIYTLVIAALSAILALIWLLLSTKRMMHYPLDLLTSAAWFAAFGILINYMHNRGCGRWFEWGYIGLRGSRCGQWKAAEAFSFISAFFWLASFVLGAYVYHKLSRDPVATDGTRRRRWGRSRV